MSKVQRVVEAVKRANIDMAVAYPITPQSESMHLVGDLYAQGFLKDYYRAENEFAVMAAVHGASLAGGRVHYRRPDVGLPASSRSNGGRHGEGWCDKVCSRSGSFFCQGG